LGWRPKGYVPDDLDYGVYEDRVRDLLADSSRARAALMTGGIVWRLAVEFIGVEGVKCVLDGPSDRVYQSIFLTRKAKAVSAQEGTPGSSTWWDDSLTDGELDLICGTYKIYTEQHSTVSWWPKKNAWESSGLNVGYWTPAAEKWFLERLERLRSNAEREERAKSSRRWKQAVRFY
ncbi:hypothetical protein DFH11DRAFT_1488066, partial [Phellopilus nigrolimitatus]